MWTRLIRGDAGALGRAAATSSRVGGAVARRAYASAETGQSMVEYAIVVAVVAIAALAAVQLFGGGVATVFQNLLLKIQGLGS
jgi:Flp pilus assembly pilin Flp